MGWSRFRKKFKKRIKKLGKNIVPVAAVVGSLIPVVGGVVSMLANKQVGAEISEEEALTALPATPASAAAQETARDVGESFPFNLPGIGPLIKSIFG
jgi:hypothetical protein